MSASNPNRNSPPNSSSKDIPYHPELPTSSNRRTSFLSSLLPISSSPIATHPRHNSLSSSFGSSIASSMATSTDRGALTSSPVSSIASPSASKPDSIDCSSLNIPSGSPDSNHPSLSGSFSSLTSSFRWPTSAGASSVHPISIPNSDFGPQANDHHTASALTGSSAPTRRTSVAAPSFRRAFELPNYSNLYANNDNSQDSSGSADAARRGRSGSLFSSFAVGDASRRTSGPPRRKLSPMGERMIRDHPF